jgi:rhomboid protease GluP
MDYGKLLTICGSKNNFYIIRNCEYWRFVTPIFLHGGIIHLGFNCILLYFIGTKVEKIYGYLKFSIIYFISGIIANIASFCLLTSESEGASGAIFGLMGGLLNFYLRNPIMSKNISRKKIIIIALITISVHILCIYINLKLDNYAHLVGFVTGFLITEIMSSLALMSKKDN